MLLSNIHLGLINIYTGKCINTHLAMNAALEGSSRNSIPGNEFAIQRVVDLDVKLGFQTYVVV